MLNALVLKTLPVHDPDQLVAIEVRNARDEASAMAKPLFDAVSQRQHSLVQVTGVLGGSVVSAAVGDTVHQAVVDGVTADYFPLLGVRVVEGRPLGSTDYRASVSEADSVAVISDGYASRMFGGPPRALGRAIILGETTVRVVGIAAGTVPGIQVGVRSRYQRPLQLTLIASVWLLVIACINLAGLEFARILRRAQEIAVSRALGASTWDVTARW